MVQKYVDGHDVEIEIAISDRRAAFDELSRAANWVGGTLLALNGGAMIAVLGRSDFTLSEAAPAIIAFAAGLGAVLIAGLSGAMLSMWLVDHANRRLDRLGSRQESNVPGWKHVLVCGFAVLASFGCFMTGTALALHALERRENSGAARAIPSLRQVSCAR